MVKKLLAFFAVLALLGGAYWYLATPHDRSADIALIEACKAGDADRVGRLLAEGADANAQKGGSRLDAMLGNEPAADAGFTPLMYAIEYRHPGVIDLLLEKGADVNRRTAIGNTALMMAANQVNYELADRLLQRGADVKIKNKYGNTAVDFSTKRDMTDKHKKLIDRLKAAGGEASEPPRTSNPTRVRRGGD